MKPKDLDCTFTFKLADEGVKRINELNKEQLKEAKRLIDKALEDYEEAKVGYIIDPMEKNCVSSDDAWYDESDIEMAKELGIWFETKEEAEKAVEKLKAWTRLKDKGARFKGWFWDRNYGTCIVIGNSECDYIDDGDDQNKKDLDLLFGGEE